MNFCLERFNKKRSALIVGAGVVGQLIGIALIKNGYNVRFLVRPLQSKKFIMNGFSIIRENNGIKSFIRSPYLVTEPPALDEFDWLIVTVRSDQLIPTLNRFSKEEDFTLNTVICCPIWDIDSIPKMFIKGNLFHLSPGISGLFRNDELFYRPGIGYLSFLLPTSNPIVQEKALELSKDLCFGGITVKVTKGSLEQIRVVLAIGLPLVIGLHIVGYSLKAYARNRRLRRLVIHASREGLIIVKKIYNNLNYKIFSTRFGLISILPMLPISIGSSILWISQFIPNGFMHEMLTIHFKKVAQQDIYLLTELLHKGERHGIRSPSIQSLLKMI